MEIVKKSQEGYSKKTILYVLLVFALTVSYWVSAEASDEQKIDTISEFQLLQDHYLLLEERIPKDELISLLPEKINVVTCSGKVLPIDVFWYTEQDYEKSDASYYLFWADWDQTAYPLDSTFNNEDYYPYFEVEFKSIEEPDGSNRIDSEEDSQFPESGIKARSIDGTNTGSNSLSIGVQNIVARAHQQVEIQWTPRLTVNGFTDDSGILTGVFYANTEYQGIPYGQLINSGRYVPHGASFDTFLSAVNDSSSVFYTQRGSYGSLDSTYYGSDCSAFVSYAYGLPRMTTSTIASSSRFQAVAGNSIYNAEVGDCFNRSGYHVELITGLTYSEDGILETVEVCEQTPPKARIRTYSPEAVQQLINTGYTLLRYEGRDAVNPPETYTGYSSSGGSMYNPEGWLDIAYGGDGTVEVKGWALDRDDTSSSISVMVYVGGPCDDPESEYCETVVAGNYYDIEANSQYSGCGKYHGFHAVFETDKREMQPIYVYAVDDGIPSSGLHLLDNSPQTVYINEKCDHEYQYSVLTAPTFSQEGILLAFCEKCLRETEITIPELNMEDYRYVIEQESTCVQEGKGVYYWDDAKDGAISFTVTLEKGEHEWGEPEYIWDDIHDDLTAEYTCKLDSSHKKTDVLDDLNIFRLPSSVTEIETEAFEGISAQVVIIPEGCTYIGSRAFANCLDLLYVQFPESVAEVAEDAFEGCVSLIYTG